MVFDIGFIIILKLGTYIIVVVRSLFQPMGKQEKKSEKKEVLFLFATTSDISLS